MDRLKKMVLQATKISFWSTLPLFIGFVLIAPFMLNIFGDEFVNGFGFEVLCILSFARLVSALTGPAGTLLQMTVRQVIFMKLLMVYYVKKDFGFFTLYIPFSSKVKKIIK